MKSMTSTIRKIHRKSQRGQSIVEFALLAPILILLFMGMFDFGWILHQQIQMDNATRLGARRGAVGDSCSEIIEQMMDNITFNLDEDQITIQVLGPSGNPVGDSEDRTPDNIILVMIDQEDVEMITPLAGWVEALTTLDLHSEANFLIE